MLFGAVLADSLLTKQQTALGEELTLIATLDNSASFKKLLEAVQDFDAVTEVKALDEQQVKDLLAPWLGGGSALLELPQVAAVVVDRELFSPPQFNLRLRRLAASLGGEVEVTDHRAHFATSLQRLEMLVRAKWLMLIALAAALGFASFFAVKSSLKAEQTTIEVLSIIGATDGSIAAYFALHGGKQVFIGGFLGLLAAAATMLVAFSAGAPSLDVWRWLAVPLVFAAFTMAVTWFSVKRLLRPPK